jgi:hypothetical protein
MAITGPYGRQWIPPTASSAFSASLIQADNCCALGRPQHALELYYKEASYNRIAKRRLNIAKKQLKKSFFSCKTADSHNELRLGFIDWYPGFEKDMNGVIEMFSRAGLKPLVSTAEDADILVAGAYGNRIVNDPTLSDDKLVIFVTGENLCPSYNIHDFSISTRTRSFCGKNIRLPQWLGDLSFDADQIRLKPCKEYEHGQPGSRDLLISAIYNNATPEREELLYCLRGEFGVENVHVFGSQRTGEVDKFQILARSVINLCLENSLGEGYVTEKLLHARAMGCKALYWGDSSFSTDFRTDGILNIRDTGSIEEVIDWCRIQVQAPSLTKLDLNYVNPSIFVKHPISTYDVSRLAEWSSVVLAWRSL